MPMVVAFSRQMLPAPHVVPKDVGLSLTGSGGPSSRITLNKQEPSKSHIPLVFGGNLCQRHYKAPRSSSPAGDLEAPLGDSVIAEHFFSLENQVNCKPWAVPSFCKPTPWRTESIQKSVHCTPMKYGFIYKATNQKPESRGFQKLNSYYLLLLSHCISAKPRRSYLADLEGVPVINLTS